MENEAVKYSRGRLPHVEAGQTPQFVTWRLTDAIPTHAIEQIRERLIGNTEEERKNELAKQIEAYADAGHGECYMRNAWIAREVQETLFYDHGHKYRLSAWVIMPNHVHVLLKPAEGVTLNEIIRRLKSASAMRINRVLERTGKVWQREYFDRYIRSEKHLQGVISYIEWNPVKAGFCRDPRDYQWSSANRDARARLEFLQQERNA